MEENGMYEGFAAVYDKFMDNIPYEEWHVYLTGLLKKYGVDSGSVVDLACGTGEMTWRLAQSGYDMTGVDISEEMLQIAYQKCTSGVLLLHQDMRELDLYGKADAMVCVCDGMNYICEIEELKKVFQKVFLFLEEKGVFIFDFKTEFFYNEILGNRTISENREDASFIWENEYDKETKINTYLLTTYELIDDENDLFVRNDEMHRQRTYTIKEVCKALKEAGFMTVDVFEAMTQNAPGEKTERLYYIARK